MVLNTLVREGVIASFETDLFDKFHRGAPPTASVTVHNPNDPEPALQQVREALAPLGIDRLDAAEAWIPGLVDIGDIIERGLIEEDPVARAHLIPCSWSVGRL